MPEPLGANGTPWTMEAEVCTDGGCANGIDPPASSIFLAATDRPTADAGATMIRGLFEGGAVDTGAGAIVGNVATEPALTTEAGLVSRKMIVV